MKAKFTRWFYKKGYGIKHVLNPETDKMETYINCPFWVKPLMFLYSPSVYLYEMGKTFSDGFTEGFNKTVPTIKPMTAREQKEWFKEHKETEDYQDFISCDEYVQFLGSDIYRDWVNSDSYDETDVYIKFHQWEDFIEFGE